MGSAMFTTGSAENKQHRSILRLWKILPVLNKLSQFQNRFLKKLSYSFLVNNKMPLKNHLSKYTQIWKKKKQSDLYFTNEERTLLNEGFSKRDFQKAVTGSCLFFRWRRYTILEGGENKIIFI